MAEPKEFIQINYTLTQSVHESWQPLNRLDHGHKHLCVLLFDNKIPSIIDVLYRREANFSLQPVILNALGFCNSKDFESIAKQRERIVRLKRLYGGKWWQYDVE